MKMECIEGSSLGDTIELRFDIPTQTEIDAGREPEFFLSLSDCPMEDHPESAYMFTAPAFEVLTEWVRDAEDADICAGWFEGWAEDIRKNSV